MPYIEPDKSIWECNIVSIEHISDTITMAYHVNGNAYIVRKEKTTTAAGDIEILYNQQDVNQLAALPIPVINLANTQSLNDIIPYFK
jgi:hypothetical protein